MSITREGHNLIDNYLSAVCKNNGIAREQLEFFAVHPTAYTGLERAIADSTDFFKRIKTVFSKSNKYSPILGSIGQNVTKRTNVGPTQKRAPVAKPDTTAREILLPNWEHDVSATNKDIANIQTVGDLIKLMAKIKRERIATDRMIVGWQGTEIDETADSVVTDLTKIDKGLPQKLSEQVPANYITEGNTAGTDKVVVGKFPDGILKDKAAGWVLNTDYWIGDIIQIVDQNYICIQNHKTPVAAGGSPGIDATPTLGEQGYWTTPPDYETRGQMVSEVKRLIPEELRAGVVAMVGENFTGQKESDLFAKHDDTPTELRFIESALARHGGLVTDQIYGMPANGLAIGAYSNIEFVIQSDTVNRKIEKSMGEKAILDMLDLNCSFTWTQAERAVYVGNISYLQFEQIEVAMAQNNKA